MSSSSLSWAISTFSDVISETDSEANSIETSDAGRALRDVRIGLEGVSDSSYAAATPYAFDILGEDRQPATSASRFSRSFLFRLPSSSSFSAFLSSHVFSSLSTIFSFSGLFPYCIREI